MTFPQDQDLESLIADLDRVLLRESNQSETDWYEVAQDQKLVLENLRDYLVSLNANSVMPTLPPREITSVEPETDAALEPSRWEDSSPSNYAPDDNERPVGAAIAPNSADYQAIAQAVVAQMNLLGINPVQTWREELTALRQERESLHQEVTQLRQERQQQLAEFLQVLTTRLQASLRQKMVQTWSNLETEFLQSQPSDFANPEQTPVVLKQLQQVEQLRRLQQETDGLLQNLDVTFRAVLTTLQRDLHSYEQSLAAGLANLYDLGKKGEVLNQSLLGGLQSGSSSLAINPEGNKLRQDEISPRNQEVSGLSSRRERLSPQVYPFAGMEIKGDAEGGSEEDSSEADSDLDDRSENEFSSGDRAIEAILELDLPPEQINSASAFLSQELGDPGDRNSVNSESFSMQTAEAVNESLANWRSRSETLDLDESSINSSQQQTPLVEEVLFAGLPDPASGSGLTLLTDLSSTPPPRNAQEFLFGEEEDRVFPLSDEHHPVTVAMSEDDAADSVETINALTELIKLPTDNSPDIAAINFEFTTDTSTSEDDYLPASPEENLLLTRDYKHREEDLENVLDENKLQQLSEDLQRFETESEALDYSFKGESSLFEENAAVDSFTLPEELLAEEDLENFPLDGLSEEVDAEDDLVSNNSSENFLLAQEFTIVSPWDEETRREVSYTSEDGNPELDPEAQLENSDRQNEIITSESPENIASDENSDNQVTTSSDETNNTELEENIPSNKNSQNEVTTLEENIASNENSENEVTTFSDETTNTESEENIASDQNNENQVTTSSDEITNTELEENIASDENNQNEVITSSDEITNTELEENIASD
ncbi:MAG: hypothetical protein SAJ37_08785, partial [Oscillatoria sp. PMC 1068.18]|nr:hypothetical protein [Oscillatoria sp. PMC 1076.18]MEC4988828.1 hypothetical protein [Oscillatoria sp. PMC 1068.18]